jgi:hypothetical protein
MSNPLQSRDPAHDAGTVLADYHELMNLAATRM